MRVLARQITTDKHELHWTWTVLGERNWRSATVSDADVRLSDSYPLNSSTGSGGTNVWEVDLVAARRKDGATVRVRLRGSQAASASSEWQLTNAESADIGRSVSVVSRSDCVPELPADVVLARVGAETVRLRVSR